MYENDVQVQAMIAIERKIEEHNNNPDTIEKGKYFNWRSSFPHSSGQGTISPNKIGADLVGLLNSSKIILIEFKRLENKKVSKFKPDQVAFIKMAEGCYFLKAVISFNLEEKLYERNTPPGVDRAKSILETISAISLKDFKAIHKEEIYKEHFTEKSLLKFINTLLTEEELNGAAPLAQLIEKWDETTIDNAQIWALRANEIMCFSIEEINAAITKFKSNEHFENFIKPALTRIHEGKSQLAQLRSDLNEAKSYSEEEKISKIIKSTMGLVEENEFMLTNAWMSIIDLNNCTPEEEKEVTIGPKGMG